jgi:hypothetical protein
MPPIAPPSEVRPPDDPPEASPELPGPEPPLDVLPFAAPELPLVPELPLPLPVPLDVPAPLSLEPLLEFEAPQAENTAVEAATAKSQ